jgi:sulfotransferase
MKKIHFLSGLPRSCSTLLCNVLAQNERVHASATSPLHEIGYIARKVFQTDEAKAVGGEHLEKMFLDYVKGGCGHAYDSITDRPVVIDKCRSYIGHLDQLFKIWPNAKVIVPIRDIRAILCSLEKKRRTHPSPFNGFEEANPLNFTTIEKRVQGWLSSPPLGIAIERLYDAATRFGHKLHFVRAEDLTTKPAETMARVWNYLGEDQFIHDFTHVEQYTHEVDIGWPYGDHIIRPCIKPLLEEWDDILGKEISNAIHQKFNWINNLQSN